MTNAIRAGLLAGALLLDGCATTAGCRWHLQLEPRVTASADGRHPVRPVASITARPVCLPPRRVEVRP